MRERNTPSILVTDARDPHLAPALRSPRLTTRPGSFSAASGGTGTSASGVGTPTTPRYYDLLAGSRYTRPGPATHGRTASVDSYARFVDAVEQPSPSASGGGGGGGGGIEMRSTASMGNSAGRRLSRASDKLVLIPDMHGDAKAQAMSATAAGFKFHDEPEDRPPLAADANVVAPSTHSSSTVKETNTNTDSDNNSPDQDKTAAERTPRDLRSERYPRTTAYCVSEGIKLATAAKCLQTQTGLASPRMYDGVLYVPYYLPLVPGGETVTLKSNRQASESKRLDESESQDHYYEYYSGLKASSAGGKLPVLQEVAIVDFDPAAPQPFSPLEDRYTDKVTQESEGSGTPVSMRKFFFAETVATPTDTILASSPAESKSKEKEKYNGENSTHAEMFLFAYGVVVFWNLTEQQEQDMLADLGLLAPTLFTRPVAATSPQQGQPQTESLHFMCSPGISKPRIFNDMITLKAQDHMVQLAMSHAIAQSAKLSHFEALMETNMADVRDVPKMLALKGRLEFKREEVLKFSGSLFKLRVDVNLSSNVLGTPRFFWDSEPGLNPLYTAMREYLEIEQRILVLNERCKVFLDLTDIIADSIAEHNMSRITWIIILLIAMSLAVSTFEIAMRFNILREAHHHMVQVSHHHE